MVNKVVRLEYGILTDLCATLLNRYNIVSMVFQSNSLDLNNAVALLESLCEYVATLRKQFDIFEKNGKALSGCSEYQEDSDRKRVRSIKLKRFEEESADADVNLSPQDKFRTGVFLEIIDSMTGALKTRVHGCLYPSAKFVLVLHEIFDLTPESIPKSSNRLVEAYPEHDLAD